VKAAPVVIVFARAPVPGRAKTRLAPRLGAWGAARLQARLTLHALRTARAARCGAVELHAAPDARHGFFRVCETRFRISVAAQRRGDLGERMHGALAAALRRHRAAILIGSDCPALRPADLRRAARALAGGCDAVLSPALDGGYALIGLRRARREVFAGVSWGKPSVLAETEARLARAGLRWRRLRAVWDVDRPEDLERLAAVRLALLAPLRGARAG
jgi:rSAM/selenodomain-associated transferase 1